jgi:hypothetical protein
MKTGKIIPNFKYFESQEDDENVIFVIRRHPLFLSVPFFFGGLLLLVELLISVFAGPYVRDMFSGLGEAIFISIMCLFLLFTVLYIFLSWLTRYLNIIILTSEHLVEIEQPVIFSRKVSELDLDCVEDATASQKGFFATMFHYGDVLIQTASELPNFNFNGVEDPNGVQQKIMETKENYMKQTRASAAPAAPVQASPTNESNNQNGFDSNPPMNI